MRKILIGLLILLVLVVGVAVYFQKTFFIENINGGLTFNKILNSGTGSCAKISEVYVKGVTLPMDEKEAIKVASKIFDECGFSRDVYSYINAKNNLKDQTWMATYNFSSCKAGSGYPCSALIIIVEEKTLIFNVMFYE